MSRPVAEVRVLTLPHLHPDAVRIETECQYSTTGLTSLPGPLFALLGSGATVFGITAIAALCGTWAYGYFRPRLPH